jgi:hypothetical protein
MLHANLGYKSNVLVDTLTRTFMDEGGTLKENIVFKVGNSNLNGANMF